MSALRDRFRDLYDPVPSRSVPHSTRNGALLLLAVLLAVFSAVTHDIPLIGGTPGTTVEADFASVNQVNDRTPVRVAGVEVGKVEEVKAGPDARRASRLVLRITDGDVEVRRDARATIRWRTLLGGSMYVDLEPGSPGSPPLGDAVLPATRTSSQVELDDVLRPYDGGTEQAQRDALKGLAEGFGDPGSAGKAIESLPQLTTVGRGVEPYRGTESGDLRRLVAATATTVEALGEDTGRLDELVTGARRTLAASAAGREDLGAFLERSPSTLDSMQSTFTRVTTTLDRLDPLVQELRPGVRRLLPAEVRTRPALDRARTLLRDLRPVLGDLEPTFGDLGAVARAGTPFVKGLEPTVDRLNAEILPWLREEDPDVRLRTFEAIGPFFSVLDMGAAGFDAAGFRLHLSTPGGSNSVITAAQEGFARTCRKAATPGQRAQCPTLAKVLAQGWFGRRGTR